jgi:hypothetical protein
VCFLLVFMGKNCADDIGSFFFSLYRASDVAHTMQHWHVYRKWVRIVVCLNMGTVLSDVSHDHCCQRVE